MNEIQKNLLANVLLTELDKHGRAKFIEETVNHYKKEFQDEYKSHLKQVDIYRKQQANDFASDKDHEFRLGASVPNRLFAVMNEVLTPRFLSNIEELRWFIKKFPEFKIPKKI